MSWSSIPFPGGNVDGDPIRGSLDEVGSVASMFDRMGTAAENIHEMFARIQEDGDQSDSLRGDFSGKLLEVLDGVAGSLSDLPGVAQSAYRAMDDHGRRLADLHDAAATALARANTRWDALQEATSALGSAESTNSRLQAQVDELPPVGADPIADADRGGVEDAADSSAAALSAAQGAVDDAEAELEASRTEWFGLRDDEDELNRTTADALDAIELGDLSDPGWFESLVSSVVDLVMDLTLLDELFTLVEALATGDWAAALWALKEILDVVLLVVAVVALFTPLGPLVLALSVVYFATTAALYATQWPNPETGQTVGLLDVGLAAVDLVPGGRLARAVPNLGAATPPVSAATPPAGAATPPAAAATPTSGGASPPTGGTSPTGGATPPANPSQYSVAYEVQLDAADFGRSRSVHFNRSNADLDAAMQGDPDFARMMENLMPGSGTAVASSGGRRTPAGWTWHHAPTSATNGRPGVMQLVPRSQHSPGTPFDPILHPGGSGGYSEWAIPNGAPPNRSRR